MGTPHKHAELLKAIADGKAVQYQFDGDSEWFDMDLPDVVNPLSRPSRNWRIKPEPKPDVVKVIHFDNDTICVENIFVSTHSHNLHIHWENHVKLTFDGETGKLKSAEVINND